VAGSTTTLTFLLTAKDAASKEFDKLGRASGGAASKMDKLKVAAKVAGVAVAGLALKFGSDSVKAYTEAEESQRQLSDALGRFPGLASTNIGRLNELNAGLMAKTKFDDDAIASGQAVLAGFKLTGKQLEETTPLLLDYAAKTGKDLPTAAKDLGRSLLGNTKSLKALGISYTSTGDATQDYANITALMREKVGGFAEGEGTTAAGKLAILKNQFGEIQETVGSKLVPALTTLTDVGIKAFTWAGSNMPIVIGVAAAVALFSGAVAAANLATTIAAAGGLKLWFNATKIGVAVQWAMNSALLASPITWIVVGIAALVAGLVWFFTQTKLGKKVWETLTNALKVGWTAIKGAFSAGWSAVSGFMGKVWEVIKKVWSFSPLGIIVSNWGRITGFFGGIPGKVRGIFAKAWDIIKRLWSFTPLGIITSNWDKITGFFTGIPGTVGSALSGVASAISGPFRSAFNFISDAWNNTIGSLSWTVPSWVPGIGGNTISVPNLPHYALGTASAQGGMAWVGERGPELVRLPRGSRVHTASQSASMTSPDMAAVVKAIENLERALLAHQPAVEVTATLNVDKQTAARLTKVGATELRRNGDRTV
jgi:hypothetical protein